MEQRSDTNIQPVAAAGAGVDPAYVPGLVNLRAPEAEETGTGAPTPPSPRSGSTSPAVRPTANADSDADSDTGVVADSDAPEAAKPEKSAADAADSAEADDDSADDGPDNGPSLEASDRRASITAGRRGVRFTLDDQEADFRWDEIGAVEVVVPRFGKRFGVIVHTHLRRSYEADAEAPSRAVLKEWSERLDAVLDAYFEDEGADGHGDSGGGSDSDSDGRNGES